MAIMDIGDYASASWLEEGHGHSNAVQYGYTLAAASLEGDDDDDDDGGYDYAPAA
ncbi:uncharacterized protein G2W53_011129 [Senna tora]|uniref:Uncharacterized protein n=1 Tax=Senna tora TaxID=362788 RepID=A0A834X0N6_9FABA|nr:uncharacterized protein G2W53_011129 [Senna tora]